jgi:predicted site-specific integrase-resolvase
MSNSSIPRLLTLQQFARRIGISVPTARVWVRQRQVSTVRFGRRRGCRIQIPETEVARLFSEGTVPAAPRVVAGGAA